MLNFRFLLLVTTFFSLPALTMSQTIRLERKMPSVEQNGIPAPLGFAGGLNSPQFNGVDLNNDGMEDLFVFDRVGNAPLALRKLANGTYRLDQDLLKNFPELEDWVLLRDYNQDGAMDIFTYNSLTASGVKVFMGSYDSDNLLTFERFPFGNELNIIFVPTPGGGATQLYISDIDYPAISDVDCDGDVDIVTFDIGGGFINYYRNQSVENGHGFDSLQYVLSDDCFGGIYESGISESLSLASAPGECAEGFQDDDDLEFRHVGSTLLCLDEDGDGDQDLILGDLSFPNLNMTTNGNTCDEVWMGQQDISFPSYDTPVNLPIFPASFYVDIDGDQRRDLIAAPNPGNNGVDHENVWYYRNQGTDDNPDFEFEKNNFLIDQMIDVGTRSHPAYLDYNADGLQDLVVSNFSYFELFGIKNTRLALYENVGTTTSPAFRLEDDDFLNMNQFSADQTGSGTFDMAATFGDLDGDGDTDALVGEVGGQLFFVENTAGAGAPVAFGAPVFGYAGIDVGQASTPQIIDLNRDGLMDIVVGEKNGNINYFQNVGSVNNPSFGAEETEAPNVKNLGQVDTRIPGFSTGYSVPHFVDMNGEYRLFVGTQFGNLEIYSNVEGNLSDISEPFVKDYETIEGLQEGTHLQAIFNDWNNNGFLDVVVGNQRGGLSFFESNIDLNGTVDTEDLTTDLRPSLKLYPNPASDQLQVELEGNTDAQVMVFDQLGRLLYESNMRQTWTTIPVTNLTAGVYFLQVVQGGERVTEKFVVE